MPASARIPYDSLTLAAVLAEVRRLHGSKVQRIVSVDPVTVAASLYGGGVERWLALSGDAVFARIHLMASRPHPVPPATEFVRRLRGELEGARLIAAEQVGFDRIARLVFERAGSRTTLIAELMGKHSNLILVGEEGRIHACLKSIGSSKSRRPVLVGRSYVPPPFEPKPTLFVAESWSELEKSEGASPFLVRLVRAESQGDWSRAQRWLGEIRERIAKGEWEPVEAAGYGAYPVDIANLGYATDPSASLSGSIERTLGSAAAGERLERKRSALRGKLHSVFLAREAAAHDLEEALDTARRAAQLQEWGELILAYQFQIEDGAPLLQTADYEGRTVAIRLDPESSAVENAQRYFEKAKRAKQAAPAVRARLDAVRTDRSAIAAALQKLEEAGSEVVLDEIHKLAVDRRWMQEAAPVGSKSEPAPDPFQGHKIRSLDGPGGFKILYGENAAANDFLTHRVARPTDWWLHVRGSASAHVVVQTGGQPQRVGGDTLSFAARIAVRNSPSKHSSYVPVDATLKKYVRKPRGAPAGTALYTHERTIHVESD